VLIPGPIPCAEPARAICIPESLPSGPQCLTDHARQPLSFASRNHYAPDPISRPLQFQTRCPPLLLTVLPTSEIPAPPRAKVLLPGLYELPVASPHLSPCLRATGKPHCHRGITLSCYAGRSLSSPLHRRDASARHPVKTPRATPLLPPPLLAPRAAPSSLQLPSPAQCRHRALAHLCAPCGHHQPPYPAHLLPTGIWTKMPSDRLDASSVPTRACSHCPSTAMRCTPHSSHPVPLTPCACL
jgi:hypothetical protein